MNWICTDARISKAANLQDAERRSQVGSGFPSHAPVGAQDWGQVLTFEGKNGPHFKAFTNRGGCDVPVPQVQAADTHRIADTPVNQADHPT